MSSAQLIDIFKSFRDKSKFVPEGVEGRVEYKGNVSKIIYQLQEAFVLPWVILSQKFKTNIKKC